jgi:DNA polymerase-3 subunit chi
MWTFDQSSFVPHELYDPKRQSGETLIAIGQQAPRRGEYTVLVSLLETAPESYDVFPRIVELVDNVPEDRTRARERYRWYRDRGCTLDNHDISV